LQVTPDNPLVGLSGRVALLRRLGEVMAGAPHYFGATTPRPGHLFDCLQAQAIAGTLPATLILQTMLDIPLAGHGSWPDRRSGALP
jgi:hypothetical protein